MLGTLLDLLAGVVIVMSLLYFGWLGVAGLISPALVGGRGRLGLLVVSVFGCAVSLYLGDAIMAPEAAAEPEPTAAATPAPAPAPDPPPPPEPPDTAWTVESGIATATGDRGELSVAVTCRGDDWIVVLDAVKRDYDRRGGTRFPDWPERAYWRWDARVPGYYSLERQEAAGRHLLTTMRNTARATTITDRMRGHAVLELRVETVLGDEVRDIFGLAGAAAVFDSLTCEDRPAPPPAPRSEAQRLAGFMRSQIGMPPSTIEFLMAEHGAPERFRSDESRYLTWTLGDGSELAFVFRPVGGPGSGLELDMVFVR